MTDYVKASASFGTGELTCATLGMTSIDLWRVVEAQALSLPYCCLAMTVLDTSGSSVLWT